MEKDGTDKKSDIRDRVNHNIEKIQETFETVFGRKQTTVKGFMVKPKGIENE
jgi:hypothetical protein